MSGAQTPSEQGSIAISELPYGKPTSATTRQSATITDGIDRAPARAMLKAIGFTDGDLARPIISVGTTWIETMPCNINQRDLAAVVRQAIRAAGGTSMEFKYDRRQRRGDHGDAWHAWLAINREVIADSIELVVGSHAFDGVACIVACGKTGPGAAMALGRLDIPSVILYSGTTMPGHFEGRDVGIGDLYEALRLPRRANDRLHHPLA